MGAFFQRMAIALCSGYIIVYFGEFVFWATPDREGMDLGGMLAVWGLYSVMAYPFLCVVSYFRVRDAWAMFLAGAFYGWFEEGVVVQTTYGTPDTPFPMSISFTALAWHAPIDIIWVGISCDVCFRETIGGRPSRSRRASECFTDCGRYSGGTSHQSRCGCS